VKIWFTIVVFMLVSSSTLHRQYEKRVGNQEKYPSSQEDDITSRLVQPTPPERWCGIFEVKPDRDYVARYRSRWRWNAVFGG